jgi:hypothetical protein
MVWAQTTDTSPPPPSPAVASPTYSAPPGTIAPSDVGNSAATPSTAALPAQPAGTTSTGTSGNGPGIDASNLHKFWTISVDLRETYDDNVNTTNNNRVTALETSILPSILVDFPMENTEFSASNTFGGTYYTDTGGTGNNLQYSEQFVAQFRHDFSGRFSLTASEQFIDSTEPDLFGTTGTPYRDGRNITNAFNSGLNAQWTPVIGTQTTYANNVVRYDDPNLALIQNNLENTATQSVSFSLVPKISLNCGGIYDSVGYDTVNRGYTSYSGFVGTTWQALPNITATIRGGGSYTESKQTETNGQTATLSQVAPYADVSASWQIGERSSLSGDYSHEVTPSDYVGANGQESDRVSANFSYAVTPQISTHLQLVYTYSDVSGSLVNTQGAPSYTETVYDVDAGAAYNFVKYFSLTFDVTESGVSSEIAALSYTRDQVSFGVRGTY